MLGLGHGGIESMVFGGVLTAATISSLLPLAGQDLSAMNLLPAQVEVIQISLERLLASPWNSFLPLLERLLAISTHVVLSLVVLQAFRKRQPLYLLLAIAYHAAIDMVAVLAAQHLATSFLPLGLIVLALLPGWLWMLLLLRHHLSGIHQRAISQPAPGSDATATAPPSLAAQDATLPLSASSSPADMPLHSPTPIAEELRIFGVALAKEILQVWRTRRVLIVAAVFGLFGLVSPLLAYFMPEMFKVIPGAEQFADLIPPPSQADAVIQYIKNISQFGFLLAILLGIGDIAGEKERGIAGMILSKPITRWAFVSSKYFTQLMLYLGGFMLATFGGWLYTWILFEPADPLALLGLFAAASGLLFAWLLPYITITLASSVLANSTSTAAGISLTLAVTLMLAGSLPQISMLMPNALTGWANALGSTPPPDFNGGALAMCLVFAVAGLVTAIGAFEIQEL
jgi:ABC-2 type transport system permease protein